MASMDDLVATVSGSMHVSQDHYDLQNFRNYLAQTMVLPPVAQSGYLPPSRSTSTNRKSQPVTTPLGQTTFGGYDGQPYPSPAAPQNSYTDYGHARPGVLQRQTSYGFGRTRNEDAGMWMDEDGMNAVAGPSSPMTGSYDAFESDAFAPLNRREEPAVANDPWARMRQPISGSSAFGQPKPHPQPVADNVSPGAAGAHNPWAAFGRSTNGFGAQHQTHQNPHGHRFGAGRMPTPPDEDDEMMSDDGEEQAQRYGSVPAPPAGANALGIDKRALSMNGLDEQDRVAALWQRGRRKT